MDSLYGMRGKPFETVCFLTMFQYSDYHDDNNQIMGELEERKRGREIER